MTYQQEDSLGCFCCACHSKTNPCILFLKIYFLLINFYWRIVALQHCVSLCCMAKWISCKSESESCSVVSNSLWPNGLYSPWTSPGQNTGVGSYSLLQGIVPTQGLNQVLNPGLPHFRQILYQLSHQGSPRILQWVVYPFSRGSSQPRNWTGVSCITGGFFTSWAIRVHISPLLWISFPLRRLQSTEQSSPCCTRGFRYLSSFYVVSVVCVYMSIPVSQLFPLPITLGVHTFVLYACVCFA